MTPACRVPPFSNPAGTGWGLTGVPSNAVMCFVCLGVLSCVTHLRTFSLNRCDCEPAVTPARTACYAV